LFGVVEAGIETGGWTPELRASRASIDTSIDNLKRKMSAWMACRYGDDTAKRMGLTIA